MDTTSTSTPPAPICTCGYKRNKDGSCNHDLPGKVTKNPARARLSRRQIKALFAPSPRPIIPRLRGTTLVARRTLDLVTKKEIATYEPLKAQPTGERFLAFEERAGVRAKQRFGIGETAEDRRRLRNARKQERA